MPLSHSVLSNYHCFRKPFSDYSIKNNMSSTKGNIAYITSGFSKLMYWNLIPSRVGFGRWLGHKDGASWMRFSALKKESPENPLGSPTMQGYREKTAIYETGNWASPDKEYLAPWSKTSQPPELWAINFCCLHYSWTTESIVFVYSSPNGLRHLANCLCSQRFRFFLCKTRIIIHFSETSYDE